MVHSGNRYEGDGMSDSRPLLERRPISWNRKAMLVSAPDVPGTPVDVSDRTDGPRVLVRLPDGHQTWALLSELTDLSQVV